MSKYHYLNTWAFLLLTLIYGFTAKAAPAIMASDKQDLNQQDYEARKEATEQSFQDWDMRDLPDQQLWLFEELHSKRKSLAKMAARMKSLFAILVNHDIKLTEIEKEKIVLEAKQLALEGAGLSRTFDYDYQHLRELFNMPIENNYIDLSWLDTIWYQFWQEKKVPLIVEYTTPLGKSSYKTRFIIENPAQAQ